MPKTAYFPRILTQVAPIATKLRQKSFIKLVTAPGANLAADVVVTKLQPCIKLIAEVDPREGDHQAGRRNEQNPSPWNDLNFKNRN
jgi:hypothetical protein